MNTAMSLVTLVLLLFALIAAEGVSQRQAGVDSAAGVPMTPSKIALNHNETLVRDTAPLK